MQFDNVSPHRLAIDPGHKESARAWTLDGHTLAGVDMVPSPTTPTGGPTPYRLIVEVPEIRDGFTKDPDSVLKVRDVAQSWQMLCQWSSVRRVRPAEWKGGSQKKPPCHRRVLKALSLQEALLVERAFGMRFGAIVKKVEDACVRLVRTGKVTRYSWSQHNELDAIGILLFDLGRL